LIKKNPLDWEKDFCYHGTVRIEYILNSLIFFSFQSLSLNEDKSDPWKTKDLCFSIGKQDLFNFITFGVYIKLWKKETPLR